MDSIDAFAGLWLYLISKVVMAEYIDVLSR
jgi:hypothetical protein